MSVSVLTIDPRDKTPIYAQIEHGLRAAIATGRLGLGEQLPTVRRLAVQLQVNANTVARVYADLEKSGVLETRRGVGSFVAVGRGRARPAEEKARRLNAFVTRALADANQAGFTVDELIGGLTAHRKEGA